MTTASPPLSLKDLVEDAIERLSSEQLYAMGSRKAAAELRAAEDAAIPVQPPDLATALAFDPTETVARFVGTYAAIGVDGDIAAAWLLSQLVHAGASEVDAFDVLHRVTGWRPRTDEERDAEVMRQMLGDGFTPEQIRDALRSISAREVG